MTTKLPLLALCKPGLAPFCFKELKKLSASEIVEFCESVQFELDDKQKLVDVFQKIGTAYSLSLILWQGEDVSNLALNSASFDLIKKFLKIDQLEFKYRILCEGISGNERRITLSSETSKRFLDIVKENNFIPIVDYKSPELIFTLAYNERLKQYTLGLKLHQTDLDKRDWRVYTHKASFRGDFASAICQSIDLTDQSKNLLSFFSRDGAIAIEAACQKFNLPLRPLSKTILNSQLELTQKEIQLNEEFKDKKIILVDDTSSNIRASANNSKLAGTDEFMSYHLLSIDNMSNIIKSQSINSIIIQMTSKDERRINEILKQIKLIAKPKCQVLFIARTGFEINEDSSMSFIWHKLIPRGSGSISLYCFGIKG